MKLGAGTPFLLLLLPVCAALGLAAWFESQTLAVTRFGLVALLILGSEVLLTAGVAVTLGERYSLREIAGLLLIVAGIAVVYEAEGTRGESRPPLRPEAPALREAGAMEATTGIEPVCTDLQSAA